MKSKMNIKSIVIMAIIGMISLFFINMSLAANTGKVTVETANLREKPDENAKILELLSLNQEVEVIEKTGDWYQVKVKGMTGYLRQDLISVNGEETKNDDTSGNETIETVAGREENAQTTQAEEQEIKLGKNKMAEDTKLKIVPVINATDTIEVKKGEEVNVIEIINGWFCIEAKATKGWVRKEKIQKEEQQNQVEQPEQTVETAGTAQEQLPPLEEQPQTVIKTLFVNSTTVNLRKEANTSSEIVTTLPLNTAVDVIAEANGWSQVKVSGKEGYISSSLLSTTKQETSRSIETPRNTTSTQTTSTPVANTTTTAETPVPATGKGNSVVATAQQYMGCKYVYGGTSPSGFDCSGFTSYVYKLHGVSLNRTAAGQYSNGTAVNRSDLQPGDLIMFGKSGINHVGIYIGGGRIIHAANASRGVTTDTINSGYYYNNYVGARRVI